MAWPISRISAISSCTLPRVRPGQQARDRLLLAHRPDPARHALPAALVAHEGGDDHEQAPEVDGVVDREHDARAERGAELAGVLDRQAQVEVVGRDEAAGGAAQQHGLQVRRRPRPRARAARAAWSRTAPRRSRACRPRPRRRRAWARSTSRCRSAAKAGPPSSTIGSDVDERLDVVDHRRVAEQPLDDRERRLVARLAAVALDRAEDRGLLAADVGAGALAHLDVEGEAVAEDVRPEEAALAGQLDRVARCGRARAGTRRARRGSRARSRSRRRRSVIASTTANGSPSISTRSLNVPGSDSSALQIR